MSVITTTARSQNGDSRLSKELVNVLFSVSCFCGRSIIDNIRQDVPRSRQFPFDTLSLSLPSSLVSTLLTRQMQSAVCPSKRILLSMPISFSFPLFALFFVTSPVSRPVSRDSVLSSPSRTLVYIPIPFDYLERSVDEPTSDRRSLRSHVTAVSPFPFGLSLLLSQLLSLLSLHVAAKLHPCRLFLCALTLRFARSPLLLHPISAFTYYLRSHKPALDYSQRPVLSILPHSLEFYSLLGVPLLQLLQCA